MCEVSTKGIKGDKMKQFKVLEIDDLVKGEVEITVVKANTVEEVVKELDKSLKIDFDSLKEIKKRVYQCEYLNCDTQVLIVECKFVQVIVISKMSEELIEVIKDRFSGLDLEEAQIELAELYAELEIFEDEFINQKV